MPAPTRIVDALSSLAMTCGGVPCGGAVRCGARVPNAACLAIGAPRARARTHGWCVIGKMCCGARAPPRTLGWRRRRRTRALPAGRARRASAA
jgi:hypothetical protein